MIVHDKRFHAGEIDVGRRFRLDRRWLDLEDNGAVERASLPDGALHPDTAVHAFRQVLRDGQP